MEYTDIELKNEQWKDIDGYDGMYQVSDLGRVRSLKFGRVKVLRARKDRLGYLNIVLCREGKQKNYKIHRLVAQAFIPNDNIFNTEINHRNEDKSDNKVSNLEYCDRSYNMTYNDLNWRKKGTKRRKLKKLYRPDLSYRQNLKIFKANGISCSIGTVNNLCRDLGLINRKQRPKDAL